jgi:hypothetical protein
MCATGAKMMILHLPVGELAHAILSILKYAVMIALSPIFLVLALFYVILHSNRTPRKMQPGPGAQFSNSSD